MQSVAGFDLFPVRELAARPWRERDAFSGGVNLSARQRNLARVAETQRVYVDHVNRRIYGSPAMIAKIAAAIPPDARG